MGVKKKILCGTLFAFALSIVKQPTLEDAMLDAMSKKKAEHEKKNRITVGKLLGELQGYSKDTEIIFGSCTNGNPLVYYRVKDRGPNVVQIELNEVTEESLDA